MTPRPPNSGMPRIRGRQNGDRILAGGSSMELIPLVHEDDGTLVVKGFAERKWAEKQNLCHLTTLLIPIKADRHSASCTVQIQVRDARKSFPCCRDIFGGHVNLDSEFWALLVGQPFDLSRIISEAAIREANEELRMCRTDNSHPHIITSRDLHQVGRIGEARWNGEWREDDHRRC